MQFSYILIDESDYCETTLEQIKEFDEKLTVEDKTTLNEKLSDLKTAHSEKNIEKINITFVKWCLILEIPFLISIK